MLQIWLVLIKLYTHWLAQLLMSFKIEVRVSSPFCAMREPSYPRYDHHREPRLSGTSVPFESRKRNAAAMASCTLACSARNCARWLGTNE